jgi:hypothetical protein
MKPRPIGDLADDFNGFVCRQMDLHDSVGFPDVHVRRRMIEGVDPNLEPASRMTVGIIPNALGYCKVAAPISCPSEELLDIRS